MLIGLGKVRLTPSKRVSPRPLDMAWFCRGHSPPLSQTGQSSGWLMSRNSMIPCCALSATLLVTWVLTTMPSATGSVQEACGLGKRLAVAGVGDVDQALAARADRREQRVVAEARDLDADLLGGADDQGVLGGTLTWTPSMVRVTRSVFSGVVVMPLLHAVAKAVEAAGSNGQPPWLRCARYSSRKYLIELEIGLVAPSARAQNERPRMLSHWSSSRSRSSSLPWPFSRRASVCTSHHVPSRHGVHLPQDSCL